MRYARGEDVEVEFIGKVVDYFLNSEGKLVYQIRRDKDFVHLVPEDCIHSLPKETENNP